MALTNRDYEVEITITGKSIVIPKGFIASIVLNTQIVEFSETQNMAPIQYPSGNQSITIYFKKQDTELFFELIKLQTEHTEIEFFGNEICVIDTRKKDELEIKLLND